MPEDPSTTPTETPPPTGDPVAPAPSPSTEPPKTFTQDELNRHVGREKAEASKKAQKDLADQLGVSVAKAREIIEAHNAKVEADKTEAERAKEEAAEARRERDEAKAEAAAEKFEKRVFQKLSSSGVGAGMEDEAAEKQIARARRLLDLTSDASDEDIAEQIAEIKADVPGLFTAKTADGKPAAPSGVTSGGPPAAGQGTPSALDKGRERARGLRIDPDKQHDPFSGPAFRRVG